MKLGTVFLVAQILGVLSAQAVEFDPLAYERVLLPVVIDPIYARPGAFGSVWITELSIRNEADVPVQLFQSDCEILGPSECGGIPEYVFPEPFPPHSNIRYIPMPYPGVLLYVTKSAAADVVFQLRVRDISRSDVTLGTEFPVVRDKDVLDRPARLLNIPIANGYREHLRVYGISSPTGEGTVAVRVYSGDSNSLVAERVLVLDPLDNVNIPLDTARRHMHAAYAEIAQLRDLLGANPPSRIRIEVVPVTTGLRFWAFLAITNNVTQTVTVVTPQ